MILSNNRKQEVSDRKIENLSSRQLQRCAESDAPRICYYKGYPEPHDGQCEASPFVVGHFSLQGKVKMKLKSIILFLSAMAMSSYGEVYTDAEGRNWQYQKEANGGLTLTATPPVTNLVVPAYIDGKPVVGISATLHWYRIVGDALLGM